MDDIARLTKLVDKLSLNHAYMGKIEEEEDTGIIYGIDSDNEDPTFNMEGEEGEKLDSKDSVKRSRLEHPETHNEIGQSSEPNRFNQSYQDFTYKNDYVLNQGSIRKAIPPAYLEKERSIISGIINIDCASNAQDLVLAWINQLKLLVQTKDDTISTMTIANFYIYIRYKTTGVLADWFENTSITTGIDTTSTAAETKLLFLTNLAKAVFEEFFGYSDKEARREDKTNVIRILSNMRLCDPCQIENFFCQVKENFYKTKERTGLLEIVESKLPYPMLQYITLQINNPERTKREKTLGLLERYAKEYRQNLCIRKIEKRFIENVNPRCCKQLEDVPQEYGCDQSPRRTFRRFSKRRYENKRYRPRRYKTFRKTWKPKYKNRFRKTYLGNAKYCPKGKKTCRCWKCQEIGHYANECPKQDRYKDQKLKMIYSLGFEPIEEDYEENEILDFDTYSIESESDYSTSEEDE